MFEVVFNQSGHFEATCMNAAIGDVFAQDIESLHDNLTAAVEAHYPDDKAPDAKLIHLLMFDESQTE